MVLMIDQLTFDVASSVKENALTDNQVPNAVEYLVPPDLQAKLSSRRDERCNSGETLMSQFKTSESFAACGSR